MITAVHIEDELNNQILLESLLKKHFSNAIILTGNATTVEDAISLIHLKKPQLVFLDIELKKGDSFQLLDKLNSTTGINFEIIFLTAFNEYAIKAFRLNAIDYLLKPISISELKAAVEKAIFKIENNTPSTNIQLLLKQLTENVTLKKIGIPILEGTQFVKQEEIIKIEASGNGCIFYTVNNKKIYCTKGLKDIEGILPNSSFVRVHHTWIINTSFLKKYYKGKNGYIEMDDNSTVPVSVRKKGDLLDF
ncbi:MAG: response regulator transcription factor [Ferruginibacter sp.]|nr:response regulator transcription factor [Ferruginibacter sp.]